MAEFHVKADQPYQAEYTTSATHKLPPVTWFLQAQHNTHTPTTRKRPIQPSSSDPNLNVPVPSKRKWNDICDSDGYTQPEKRTVRKSDVTDILQDSAIKTDMSLHTAVCVVSDLVPLERKRGACTSSEALCQENVAKSGMEKDIRDSVKCREGFTVCFGSALPTSTVSTVTYAEVETPGLDKNQHKPSRPSNYVRKTANSGCVIVTGMTTENPELRNALTKQELGTSKECTFLGMNAHVSSLRSSSPPLSDVSLPSDAESGQTFHHTGSPNSARSKQAKESPEGNKDQRSTDSSDLDSDSDSDCYIDVQSPPSLYINLESPAPLDSDCESDSNSQRQEDLDALTHLYTSSQPNVQTTSQSENAPPVVPGDSSSEGSDDSRLVLQENSAAALDLTTSAGFPSNSAEIPANAIGIPCTSAGIPHTAVGDPCTSVQHGHYRTVPVQQNCPRVISPVPRYASYPMQPQPTWFPNHGYSNMAMQQQFPRLPTRQSMVTNPMHPGYSTLAQAEYARLAQSTSGYQYQGFHPAPTQGVPMQPGMVPLGYTGHAGYPVQGYPGYPTQFRPAGPVAMPFMMPGMIPLPGANPYYARFVASSISPVPNTPDSNSVVTDEIQQPSHDDDDTISNYSAASYSAPSQLKDYSEDISSKTIKSKAKHGRRGVRFNSQTVEKLKQYFQMNMYPTFEERQKLASDVGLSVKQVSSWFVNQRLKMEKGNML